MTFKLISTNDVCIDWLNTFCWFLSVREDNKIFHNKKVVKVGRSIGFTCNSVMGVQWLFNGSSHKLPKNVMLKHDSTRYTLLIKEAIQENGGSYTCLGSNGTFYFYAKATLQVLGMV